jgi:hypothetical protein
MYEFKPDYEKTRERIAAFWERDLIDRPVVMFGLSKPPEEQAPWPASHHVTPEERWTDAHYQADLALAAGRNHEFLGDTLPVAFPNLGPEIFSALYGCPVHFGDYGTSWTDPILDDWSEADQLQLDWNSPWLAKLHEITDALLEAGRGKFIVGSTDWHPGGDAIAAFRDPQRLAVDMLERRDDIKKLLVRLEADYFKLYDMFNDKLRAAGQPSTSWTPLVYDGRYYIPSNDFSIMISKRMFDDVFLPGIINECRFYERSIYHLDGPGALRHLDSLLGIEELHAVQWVFGAGNEGFHRWVNVYKKIQAAGKGIQVNCSYDELEQIMETLDPRGVFLMMDGVPDRDAALEMLKRLEKWAAGRVHPAAIVRR